MGQGAATPAEPPQAPSQSWCQEASSSSSKPDQKSDTIKVTCSQPQPSTGVSQPDPSCDTVSVSAKRVSSKEVVDIDKPSPRSPPRPQRPLAFQPSSSSFACGLGGVAGPEVIIETLSALSVVVSWRYGAVKDVRKWHFEVIEGVEEIAFFEADSKSSSFEVPLGTLKRASGPYCIQVAAESGPAGPQTKFSKAGVSRTFWTPPEVPAPVVWPRLTEEPSESRLCVEWDAPPDDGGSPIKEYKIVLYKKLQDDPDAVDASVAVGASVAAGCMLEPQGLESKKLGQLMGMQPPIATNIAQGLESKTRSWSPSSRSEIGSWTTRRTWHVIDSLTPGTNYCVEVCACSEANLVSASLALTARCAVSSPGPPTAARAQLRPSLPSNGKSRDTVRIEFCAPFYDGGQPLQCFRISSVDSNESIGSLFSAVCNTSVVDATAGLTGKSSSSSAGCPCICDVEVSPNKAYTFVVQASNGDRLSIASGATPAVFVPARVPSPPDAPPEVFTEQGGIAELKWESPETGGGFPVSSFKVGIMRCLDPRQTDDSSVIREVTIARESARLLDVDFGLPAPQAFDGTSSLDDDEAKLVLAVEEAQVLWGTRIDGLEADTRYRFVIAASNCLGTGCWSAPSGVVSTPVAAPAAPANAVATVALDSQRRTAVTVSWEPGQMSSGCGNIVAFHLTLTLEQVNDSVHNAFWVQANGQKDTWKCGIGNAAKVHGQKDAGKALYDRLPVSEKSLGKTGIMTWCKPLLTPGRYRVELTSENTMGQRSAPAVLALSVSPEAFATPEPPAQVPCWAEEPLMLRGKGERSELAEQRFLPNADGDEHSWLDALLLWSDDSGSASSSSKKTDPWSSAKVHAASVDVICYYRSPGQPSPASAQVAILGQSVTTSRLQVTLPANVPMSLRLAVRADQPSSGPCPANKTYVDMPQSDALLLLLSEAGHQLSARWEVWSRDSPGGAPPRWTSLPSALDALVEAAWLEGHPKAKFTIPVVKASKTGGESEQCDLEPGVYQIVFGDDRQVQHNVKRLGLGGWQAKARRLVSTVEGDTAEVPDAHAEDLCVICMERRRTHAFMHSDTGDGHLAVCSSCAETFRSQIAAGSAAQAFRTCPMCRSPFSSMQRIFQ